jgi:Ni/Co efflux regulator RcnB
MMKPFLPATAVLALMFAPALGPILAPAQAVAQARRHWRSGDTLPLAVLSAGPNVDYAAQHLRRPPQGYGWFGVDGAFLLASLSNGLVVEVVE